MMGLELSAEALLPLTKAIVLVGIAINCAEVLYSREDYRPGGILDWNVLKTSSRRFLQPRLEPLFDTLFGYHGVLAAFGLQAAAVAVSALFLLLGVTSPWPTGLLLALWLLNHYRNAYGMDGADQMTVIVLAGLFLAELTPHSETTWKICLWFVGLQSVLSYFTAGIYKIIAKGWRSGESLTLVMSTEGYGRLDLSTLLRRQPPLGKSLSWILLAFECLFPAVLFAGPAVCLVFLVAGVIFHFLNAVIMGLNNFFWAFVATYPAVYFCSATSWAWIVERLGP